MDTQLIETEIFVVEYSVKQNAIHVQPLFDRLKENFKLAIDHISMDYQPIAVASSHESATKIAEQFRTILNYRRN
ncbi:MAG: hypothetical protein KIT33_15080 [Candidatus Kapabacteria bacterium]|nr:hypothetical protein [Ignavibacteriota bacterium]MCW5886293.1 hypothetical protein [Candidatus Kapabacteria bacterium]